MAFGKWSMYIGAVIFLVIGLGALAVAIVPGFDEWVAEQTLDATGATDTFDRFDDGDELRDTAVDVITDDDIGAVQTTSLILAATFLPMAGLFVFIGRWFKSMEPSFNSMMQTSAQMAANSSAMYQQYGQGTVVPGSGVINGPPPAPTFGDPINQPPLG